MNATSIRLWLLWQMAAGVGRRRLEGEGPALIAEDIVRLREAEGIGEIELVRLEKAGDLHPHWYDWMLVIDIDDEKAQHPIEVFFEELYSVGARPILLREAQDDWRTAEEDLIL